jgi:hypothetical protein
VRIWYGLDPGTGRWGCPMRQRWGLGPHQEMSPGLEDKLAFTVTATGSYEAAAALAQKWHCEVDDSTLHALTRRLGTRAERQTQGRLASVAAERTPQRAAAKLAVFMLDGYLARYRGPGWGKRKTKKKRVEWHEIKTGVFYLQEQAAGPKEVGGVLREGGGLLAGGGPGAGTAIALGGAASGVGAGGVDFGVGGWGGLDLECGGGPLGRRRGALGFLSRQRAPLGVGACPVSRGRGPGVGGEPVA